MLLCFVDLNFSFYAVSVSFMQLESKDEAGDRIMNENGKTA